MMDPNIKKFLKNFINTRKDQFFNINKKDIVNKLYKQIVNFIVVNSWLRKWDKGENGWYEKSGNGKTFGFHQTVLLLLHLSTHKRKFNS